VPAPRGRWHTDVLPVQRHGVPADALPDVEPAPLASEDLVDVATRAVDAIADAINTAVSPAIAMIEG